MRVTALLLVLLAACAPTDTPDAPASGTLFVVQQEGRYGYIDAAGTLVIPARYDEAAPFHDGLALVRRDGLFGYIDAAGKEVIPARYADAWHFSEGYAPVFADSAWTFIDKTGEPVDAPPFDIEGGLTSAGPADATPDRFEVSGQYGFVGEAGDTLVAPQYEGAWVFHDGLARVRQNGRWGFLDASGAFAIPAQYDQAWDFENGLARVEVGGARGYIDRTGRYVWNPSR